jgi:hypothetical protein
VQDISLIAKNSVINFDLGKSINLEAEFLGFKNEIKAELRKMNKSQELAISMMNSAQILHMYNKN